MNTGRKFNKMSNKYLENYLKCVSSDSAGECHDLRGLDVPSRRSGKVSEITEL